MKKKTLLIALIAVNLFIMSVTSILAEPINSVHSEVQSTAQTISAEQTMTELEGGIFNSILSETSLQGGIESFHHYFNIEPYWNMKSIQFVLDYKATPFMENEVSSVTLLMNGTPFHSFRPDTGGDQRHSMKFDVPVELLQRGANALTIQGDIRTRGASNLNACYANGRDIWLNVLAPSRLVMHYDIMPMENSIRDFMSRFNGLDTVSEDRNAVVIPNDSAALELTAATYALAGLARENPLKDKVLPLFELGSSKIGNRDFQLIISLYEHLTDELKNQITEDELNGKALFKVIQSEHINRLVVTALEAELLIYAGRMIANQPLMEQIDAPSKVIDLTTYIDTPVLDISRNLQLTSTGNQLNGERHQVQEYYINMPSNRSIAEASKLKLRFRYAKNLDFERALVTVYLNDIPIGSKKLRMENADNDELNLHIPKNTNISGSFSVRVAFDLEIPNDTCIEDRNQMPWAYVDKESMLQLNTSERADLLFNNYPYPFIRDGGFNQVAIVLPFKRDVYLLSSLANVIHLLGQYMQTNTGNVQVYTGDVSHEELQGKQIIAFGTFEDNQIIQQHNESLYFQYDKITGGFNSNEKMTIDNEYGMKTGTLQLINSPYNERNGMLIVTGAKSELVFLASQLISIERMLWSIHGDGVLTDLDGKLHVYRFKKSAAADEPGVIDQLRERPDVVRYIVISVLVLILILVSLFFILGKYRHKKKRGGVR